MGIGAISSSSAIVYLSHRRTKPGNKSLKSESENENGSDNNDEIDHESESPSHHLEEAVGKGDGSMSSFEESHTEEENYNDPPCYIDEPPYNIAELRERTAEVKQIFGELTKQIQKDILQVIDRTQDTITKEDIKAEQPKEKYMNVIEKYMNFKDDAVDITNIHTGNPYFKYHNPANIRINVELEPPDEDPFAYNNPY
eukprot:gene3183-6280_t